MRSAHEQYTVLGLTFGGIGAAFFMLSGASAFVLGSAKLAWIFNFAALPFASVAIWLLIWTISTQGGMSPDAH